MSKGNYATQKFVICPTEGYCLGITELKGNVTLLGRGPTNIKACQALSTNPL